MSNYAEKINLFTLHASIFSNFWSIKDIKKWAYELIEYMKEPPSVLTEFFLAKKEDEVVSIIEVILKKLGILFDEEYQNILLGLYFLKFKSGDLTIDDFLSKLIDISDEHDFKRFDPEYIHTVFFEQNHDDEEKYILIEKLFQDDGLFASNSINNLLSAKFQSGLWVEI